MVLTSEKKEIFPVKKRLIESGHCLACGDSRHWSRQCKNTQRYQICCYVCKKKDHLARDCDTYWMLERWAVDNGLARWRFHDFLLKDFVDNAEMVKLREKAAAAVAREEKVHRLIVVLGCEQVLQSGENADLLADVERVLKKIRGKCRYTN